MPTAPAFIVGAYASMPTTIQDQVAYYDALAEAGFVTGLEIPYPGQLADPESRAWLLEQVAGRFTNCIITAIPGTMQRVAGDPDFGLASPQESSRQAALEFMEEIRHCVKEFNEKAPGTVAYVEVHSAPTDRREITPFINSLLELEKLDWYGAELLIEHCDASSTSHQAEKGFLNLKDEIDIAGRTNVKIALNWGRSAVEGRSADLATEHIHEAARSTKLCGVIFSGASPEATQYGPEWIDGHLPLSTDEPSSLMTPQRIAEAVKLVTTDATKLDYLGAKIQAPQDASVPERLAMVRHIYDAVYSA